MRIPLFVSASGILVVLALGFAWAFRRLGETYERPYVRDWTTSWLALAAYGFFAGLALLAVNSPSLAVARTPASLASIFAAWIHLRALLAGMERLCNPDRPAKRWPLIAVSALLATSAVLVLWPTEPRSPDAMRLYLIRVSLLALAWSGGYARAASLMLRQRIGGTSLGRKVLLVSLFTYGALRLTELSAHFVGPMPILGQFLTFGGLPLLVGVGAGMLIALLEAERTRAVEEATARTAAERSATESEARLAAALATSTDPVFVVDRNGLLVSSNRVFVQLAYAASGVIVQPGTPMTDTMDDETLEFWRDALARVLSGEALARNKRFRFRVGPPTRTFLIRFTPVLEGGSIIGALVVAHDATEEERLREELARRDEWFRSLIEHSSDMIFQVNSDGRIEYASPSVDRILGYGHQSLVGTLGFDLVHPDDVPTVADALRRSLERDETVPRVVPLRARSVHGEYIPLEGVSRPYVERDGSDRLIVALRDVRERERLEHELSGARRLEAIGRLAGGVAHDFNNLLTAVTGNVTLLGLKTGGRADIADHLSEIDQAVQRGAELTRRLLAFARQQRIEPRVLHVPAQIADLERLLRRLLGDDILVDIDLPATLWSIRADATAFEQILVNLAVNARDAMPQGGSFRVIGRNLTVGPSGRESLNLVPGDWVELVVEDTGAGIPPELVERIFEPFFTTKSDRGGTGLGLATVYGAITQMGGKIRVDSTPGVGTRFTLHFPRIVAPHEPQTPTAAPALPRAREGEIVLLMEDETPVREVTAKLLRRLGYEVLTAEDGESGVALAEADPRELAIVVSDIVMPGIHGDQACARIRESRPGTPVLFISGFSQEALRWQHGMPAGSRLLTKPFSLEDLAASVREMIDSVPVA